MLSRSELLSEAVDKCFKDIYSFVQPHIEWDDFIEKNRIYSERYKEWEQYIEAKNKNLKSWDEWKHIHPDWENKSITKCIGPRPYEFYYLPREIMKDICDSYVDAYKMDNQQELLDTIEILKNYCREPIIDKYIEGELREDGTRWPGHRGYDHPDNLEREIFSILKENSNYWKSAIGEANPSDLSKELQNKFFEFLDMAGNFYNWNSELNSFNMSVYLGPSPNSNKEAVIENWRKYENKDIEINEEQIKKDYYGEDELD